MLNKNTVTAEKFALEVAEGRKGDNRWEVNAKIVRSRIARDENRAADAKTLAEKAVAEAKQGPHQDCLADATVALGEAELLLGNDERAKTLFLSALQISQNMSNPKWTGACYLHLTETYLREQNFGEAHRYLERWNNLSPHIENGFLHSFAAELKARIGGDFYLRNDLGENALVYKNHAAKLNVFLYERALQVAGGNKERASKLLGVSRQALHQWLSGGRGKKRVDPGDSGETTVGPSVTVDT